MSKILYITPHLSTGGLPQYLYKKIENLIKDIENDIYLIEWEDRAPIYRVQKDLIEKIINKPNFISWEQGTSEQIKIEHTINFIKGARFDIIHLEEFPELFLPDTLINFIYNSERSYKIVETSHCSDFSSKDKRVLPDSFIFVSQYQMLKYKHLNVVSHLAQYPIEENTRPDRSCALKKLNLDPNYKHVLNVGLFTPGKNQKYIFKLARILENIQFHFIGNQAINFKHYWEPLMNNLPPNCIIHNELNNVDKWYSATDLLLFTSLSELNPLVIREALSYKQPILMNNLPIYLNQYNNNPLITFLSNDCFKDSLKIIKLLDLEDKPPKIKLVHLLTRPEDEREQKSITSLSKLKDYSIDYIQHVNEPCKEYPEHLKSITTHQIKQPGYYGAYTSFRRAIEEEFTDDLDFFMICECDCVLLVDLETFVNKLIKICDKLEKNQIDYFSFGPYINQETGNRWSQELQSIDAEIFITDQIILAHCILFRKGMKSFLINKYQELGWDSPDLWLNYAVSNECKLGLLYQPLAEQYEGLSLIDNTNKGTVSDSSFDTFAALKNIYENINKNPKKVTNINIKINYNFIDGPFIETLETTTPTNNTNNTNKYKYTFTDLDNNSKVIHTTTLPPNHFTKANRKYYTNWNITVTNTNTNQTIFNHNINLNNQNVLISFESRSFGDTLAWIPYVNNFCIKHNCKKVFCSTFHNYLFKNSYTLIDFVEPGTTIQNIHAVYRVGCFTPSDDKNLHPIDWRTIPLQKVASDILGLKYQEIRPLIDSNIISSNKINKKHQVCIATHSTAQAKYWNNFHGWQKVVDYLKSLDYDVLHISRESGEYMGNKPPQGVIDKTGENIDISERIIDIQESEFFIGLSSGLSWLAWALNTPVIMISGITKPFNEPDSMIKIHNYNVCNGCFNDTFYNFDKGNWHWCPNNQNFLCTRAISPELVIENCQQFVH